jgi:hypothetical protein
LYIGKGWTCSLCKFELHVDFFWTDFDKFRGL